MLQRLELVRHIVNYAGVAAASKLVPLASILIFSRMMTVEDYGVINVFTSYIWILGIALSLNLYTAVGRFAYEPSMDFPRLLGTTLIAIAALFGVGVLTVSLGLPTVAGWMRLPSTVVLMLLVVVLGQIAESLLTQVAIYRTRSGLLLRIVAGRAVLTMLLSLALLAWLQEDRYLGVLWADTATSALLILWVAVRLGKDAAWTLDRKVLRTMASYSLPLIPYMLSLTLLAQLDRMMIDRLYGKEATGLYSMAFNVGMLLSLLISAVLNAYNPRFFDAMNQGDHPRMHADSRQVLAIAVLCAAGVVLLGQDLAAVFLPARYAASFPLIPVVTLGALCSVIFQLWGRVIGFVNRNGLLAAIAVAAVALKVALNLWWLPRFGWTAAAWSTLAAYLLMSLLCAATVSFVVRLVRANIALDLAYVALLAAASLALEHWPLPLPLSWALRLVALAALTWVLRKDLRALMQARGAMAPPAAGVPP